MNLIMSFFKLTYSSYFVMLACFCFYYLKQENKNSKKIIRVIYYLIFAIAFFIFFRILIQRLIYPQIWDFTAFYLYGKAGASGYNFYLPENFHTIFNFISLPPLNYSEFSGEVVNVGFLYPPPTIFLFIPLGFLSYNTALICWTIFNLFFAFGSILLIYNMFFKQYKADGLIFVATIFFLLLPVRLTVIFSQTNFILLFLLLLMKKYSDKNFAGIFLTLALFTKPYMIIFGLIFIIIKNWGAIIYFIISSIAIVGVTLLAFGESPFLSYIFNNPAKRLPEWVFSEDINQSLHAILIRLRVITVNTHHVYTMVSATILLLMGVYLIYLAKRKLYDYIWAILLLVGLLIYPGTLSYYGVLLLFIIFQFFDGTKQLGFKNIYFNIAIISVFYYLSSVYVFAAILFLLLVLISKSFQTPNEEIINAALNYTQH